ncbi:diguanylate cyclase [Sneathiella sp. P13V-1]|uniref:diguanylate cyclase domain-containing protein n=1 Tax=Sneathiella sp. P13V-1 TaxID=2697366 RepID=UPI00187B8BF4|nr:diguanylate cyclase [Sneathiella sp. P13V-1]MBE7637371.1 diguanylate cyclase [Sneathiella sp. P13V-1]
MAVSANILLISEEPNDFILTSLQDMDFGVVQKTTTEIQQAPQVAEGADIVVLHLPQADKAGQAIADDLVEQNKALLIIGANHRPSEIQSISIDFCDLEFKRRLYSLHRVNIMSQEYERRSETTELYGLKSELAEAEETSLDKRNVLILGNDSTMLGDTLLHLENKTNVRVSPSPDGTIDLLRERRFDALIVFGAGQGDVHFRLCTDIRADSRLYNLPIIFLLDNRNDRKAAYIHGASDIVIYPDELDQLAARLSLHTSRTDYRFQLQQLFRTSKPLAVMDGLTELYSYGFVQSHLGRLIENYHQTNRHLTFAVITLKNLEEINSKYGYHAGDQILRQMGNILSFLVRGEDFCGRYSGDKFIIALPSTSIEDAGIALNRIFGVTNNTEYSVHGSEEPVFADIHMGCAQLQEGETLKEVEKRAKKDRFNG